MILQNVCCKVKYIIQAMYKIKYFHLDSYIIYLGAYVSCYAYSIQALDEVNGLLLTLLQVYTKFLRISQNQPFYTALGNFQSNVKQSTLAINKYDSNLTGLIW